MDLTIPEPVERMRAMVRALGENRLRPLGIEADRRGAALPSEHPFFREALSFGLAGGLAGQPEKGDAKQARTGARRAIVLAEEAAYWDRGMATSLPGPGLGGPPIMIMGNADQKQRFLGMFERPTEPRWGAFAMSEPGAGSDVAAIRTRARREGDRWVIDGEKMFISNGARASWVVVWATIDPALGRRGHRAFVVERGTPGFEVARVDKKMGLAASETASLSFQSCAVPEGNMLGAEADGGFKGAMATFNITRPIVAAMAVGIGRAAYDEARRFMHDHFTGASAHRVARARERLGAIRRKLEAARLLAWHAAWLADHRRPNAAEAAQAKAYAPPIALEAASLGIDILGEAGAASDYLIEKLFRDVKVLDIVEGTGQIQRLVMARHLVSHGVAHE